MKQYLDLGRQILDEGNIRADRTKTGTISLFGPQFEFDLREGFPLVTTKKTYLKGVIAELIWMLEGSTSATRLNELGAKIWDHWAVKEDVTRSVPKDHYFLAAEYAEKKGYSVAEAMRDLMQADAEYGSHDPNRVEGGFKALAEAGIELDRTVVDVCAGELGPVYGAQWRSWAGDGEVHDQFAKLNEDLRLRPYSRRHLISTWNVPYLPDETLSPQENVINGKMALAPCHVLFQFYVEDIPLDERVTLSKERGYIVPEMDSAEMTVWMDEADVPSKYLSCKLYQRSCDLPIGLPFNIASYSLLTMMLAQCHNMVAKRFVHTFGDVHIYSDQIELFKEQLKRTPHALPKIKINPEVKDLFSFKVEDFELIDYKHDAHIPYPVAI